jgi:hypothetical protein
MRPAGLVVALALTNGLFLKVSLFFKKKAKNKKKYLSLNPTTHTIR